MAILRRAQIIKPQRNKSDSGNFRNTCKLIGRLSGVRNGAPGKILTVYNNMREGLENV